MNCKPGKILLVFSFFCLMLLAPSAGLSAQKKRVERIYNLYDCLKDYGIAEPKTVLAVAVYETGWLECKNCTLQLNNLFGFRTSSQYIRFANIYQCLEYMKRWQEFYYVPWQLKHPNGTYYQFLIHMKYAKNTDYYIHKLRPIEKWIDENFDLDGEQTKDAGL